MLRFNNVLSMERLWHHPVSPQGIYTVTESTPANGNSQTNEDLLAQASNTQEEATSNLPADSTILTETPLVNHVSEISSPDSVEMKINDEHQASNTTDLQNNKETAPSESNIIPDRAITEADIVDKGKQKLTQVMDDGPSITLTKATPTEEEPTTLSISSSSSITTPQTPSSLDSLLQYHNHQQKQQQTQPQRSQGHTYSFGKFPTATLPPKAENTTTSLFRRETIKLNQRRKSFTKKIKRVLSHSKIEIKRHSM